MDPFAVIILGGVGGLVIALLLIGRFYPGSGAESVDWKPTRSAEVEVQNEIDDLDQMLRATNARRRARGKPELTEDSIAAELSKETALAHKRRDDDVGDLEIAQMLDAKNARRRKKGQPPLSLEEYKRSIGGPL
ncbi:MAG: hypothetical protein JWO90_1734 [Solirubrobacterales bacterium]|jgi:hypothetical protein|nr:hypothetical protein [Solirubrobacterales bacterium]